MALLLLEAGATVTICHSKTAYLGNHTSSADIDVYCTHFYTSSLLASTSLSFRIGRCTVCIGRFSRAG